MKSVRCEGFSFCILEGGIERHVRLMGSGGLMGDGLLSVIQGDMLKIELAAEKLLERARNFMKTNGFLFEWRGDLYDHKDKIQKIVPNNIISVHPIIN